ncbi:MAG TPA: branched-chain amino acid ABC transporter permease [Chloroflexia bacterium]|nr:branched-chain amino acid ABC transporter permease [Chloroflexia bacterium]
MQTSRIKVQNLAGPLGVVALIAFPFALAALRGQDVNSGDAKFWQGVLIQVFILAIYAMSYNLLMGFTGILSFGHAMFFGSGAYATGILLTSAGWTLEAVVPAVIVIAVLQSLVIGVLSLRVRGVYLAMVTLAFAQMFFILAEATDFRQWTGAEDGLHSIPVPAWLSPTDERVHFYLVALGFCVAVYILIARVVASPAGHVLIAIRENEARAQAIGYNTFIYKLMAMVLSGVLAAGAGLLNALWNTNANPEMLSAGTTINALLMTIIGGVGTLAGPVLGAAVLQLLGYWLSTTFGPRWPLLFGLVYIAIVLFFPHGLAGTWQLRGAAWRRVWMDRLRGARAVPPGDRRR